MDAKKMFAVGTRVLLGGSPGQVGKHREQGFSVYGDNGSFSAVLWQEVEAWMQKGLLKVA